MDDSFGDRFKGYELATQSNLMGRSNMFIRIDGRAFHTYTKDCDRPFDDKLISAMDDTAIALCEEIQGAKMAYIQSDEISVWATGYDNIGTNAWFGGNIQKITSIAASVATAKFNQGRLIGWMKGEQPDIIFAKGVPLAHFDARVFLVPDISEVANAFKWRSDDCARNSIQMFARSHFSHKQLEGKSISCLHEMLHDKFVNWNDLAPKYKRGRLVAKKDGVWTVLDLTDFTFSYWMSLVNEYKPKESSPTPPVIA